MNRKGFRNLPLPHTVFAGYLAEMLPLGALIVNFQQGTISTFRYEKPITCRRGFRSNRHLAKQFSGQFEFHSDNGNAAVGCLLFCSVETSSPQNLSVQQNPKPAWGRRTAPASVRQVLMG